MQVGKNKKIIVPKVLETTIVSEFPSSRIGTLEYKTLWILDKEPFKIIILIYLIPHFTLKYME